MASIRSPVRLRLDEYSCSHVGPFWVILTRWAECPLLPLLRPVPTSHYDRSQGTRLEVSAMDLCQPVRLMALLLLHASRAPTCRGDDRRDGWSPECLILLKLQALNRPVGGSPRERRAIPKAGHAVHAIPRCSPWTRSA